MSPFITEHVLKTERQTLAYLQAGPAEGPLVILVHGYPDLATCWRQQMLVLAGLGFRTVAPNMRGYAGSSAPMAVEAYAIEESVGDLLGLLAHLGEQKAVWVGHDCGAAAIWGMVTHHPEKCVAVANLCVPYFPQGFTLDVLVSHVNREIYPLDKYSYGQWGYWAYQVFHADESDAQLDADVAASIKLIFQRTSVELFGTNTDGQIIVPPLGWTPMIEYMKDKPIASTVLCEGDYWAYVASAKRNGFGSINSYYRNCTRNAAYAATAVNGGRIHLPVLFIHARFDRSCQTVNSDMAEPMRAYCSDLVEVEVEAGHWLQQERPAEVSAALVEWLATRVEDSFAPLVKPALSIT